MTNESDINTYDGYYIRYSNNNQYNMKVEELLQEIDVMSMHIKRKYGSPYGNQTCNWS